MLFNMFVVRFNYWVKKLRLPLGDSLLLDNCTANKGRTIFSRSV